MATGVVGTIAGTLGPFDPEANVDVSGSELDVRNLRTSQTDRSDDGWWARLELAGATLRVGKVASIEAFVFGRARDAQPADALVAANTAVPGWVASAFRMPNLRVRGSLRATASSFGIHSFVATGRGARIRVEYQARDGWKGGLVLVETGDLAVGIALGSRGTSVMLMGAEAWFEQCARTLGSPAGPR